MAANSRTQVHHTGVLSPTNRVRSASVKASPLAAAPQVARRQRRGPVAVYDRAVTSGDYRQASFDVWQRMAEGWDRQRRRLWEASHGVGE
jgi:hypothetical protein